MSSAGEIQGVVLTSVVVYCVCMLVNVCVQVCVYVSAECIKAVVRVFVLYKIVKVCNVVEAKLETFLCVYGAVQKEVWNSLWVFRASAGLYIRQVESV